jgi:hypothetical protein
MKTKKSVAANPPVKFPKVSPVAAHRPAIMVPQFTFHPGDVAQLHGVYDGVGDRISGETYQERIILHAHDGACYSMIVDTRIRCAAATFYIANRPYYYPIVRCLPLIDRVDPATGEPERSDAEWEPSTH